MMKKRASSFCQLFAIFQEFWYRHRIDTLFQLMMTREQWKLISVKVLALALGSPLLYHDVSQFVACFSNIALITADVITFVLRIGEIAMEWHVATGSCISAASFRKSIRP